jgi:hypothetical protein
MKTTTSEKVDQFIPLPNTKAEGVATGDPRKSIAERYGDHDGYVRAVSAAAEKLVRKRAACSAERAPRIEAWIRLQHPSLRSRMAECVA